MMNFSGERQKIRAESNFPEHEQVNGATNKMKNTYTS